MGTGVFFVRSSVTPVEVYEGGEGGEGGGWRERGIELGACSGTLFLGTRSKGLINRGLQF